MRRRFARLVVVTFLVTGSLHLTAVADEPERWCFKLSGKTFFCTPPPPPV